MGEFDYFVEPSEPTTEGDLNATTTTATNGTTATADTPDTSEHGSALNGDYLNEDSTEEQEQSKEDSIPWGVSKRTKDLLFAYALTDKVTKFVGLSHVKVELWGKQGKREQEEADTVYNEALGLCVDLRRKLREYIGLSVRESLEMQNYL